MISVVEAELSKYLSLWSCEIDQYFSELVDENMNICEKEAVNRKRMYDEGVVNVANRDVIWRDIHVDKLTFFLQKSYNAEEECEKRLYMRLPKKSYVDEIICGTALVMRHHMFPNCSDRNDFNFRVHVIGYYPNNGGVVNPTPNYIHSDGVDWTSILLLHKEGVCGGENLFYSKEAIGKSEYEGDIHKIAGVFLNKTGDMVVWNDREVGHHVTPIKNNAIGSEFSARVILILDLW